MDLSKIEGLTLTTEQQEAIMAAHTATVGVETQSLINKNNDLLGEKQTRKEAADAQDLALEEARKVAAKAEEQKLISEGKTDELKAHYEKQLAESTAAATASADKATKALLSRDTAEELTRAKGLIHDSFTDMSGALLSNMLKVSYNDDNVASYAYEHNGEVVAKNTGEFESWAKEQPMFQNILKGVNSSGANTQQSISASGVADTLEACKGDKALEAAYFNKQLLG